MADESLITPDDQIIDQPGYIEPDDKFLLKDNYLSEYIDPNLASIVRGNLGVPSVEDVYSKLETKEKINNKIKKALDQYSQDNDLEGFKAKIEELVENVVKDDGSTSFKYPLSGVDPIKSTDLTTKLFVERLLKEHLQTEDPHKILPDVNELLEKYVLKNDVYSKSSLYTQSEINKLLSAYIKKDSASFTKPVIGVDPQVDGHLTTKRYVDKSIYNHIIDVDPHGFLTILSNRLALYIKRSEVYDKTQTYSRTQIDNIIQNIVNEAVIASIGNYKESIDDKFEQLRQQKFIKEDGSRSFKNPIAGVNAENPEELTTLQQVLDLLENVKTELNDKECEWKTSGPVIGSAGLVEIGTEFAKTLTLLEIMDAIFYGKGLNILVPDFGFFGDSVDVTVCVQGSLAELEYAELFQNGELIYHFTKEEFEELTCITIKSKPITEDTEFVFKASYVNGSEHLVEDTVKLSMPVFVGIIPKWERGYTVTYAYLKQLTIQDPINNKFYAEGNNVESIKHQYNFQKIGEQYYMMAVPVDYPDLYQMSTPSQLFGADAFDKVTEIPLLIPGSKDPGKLYRLYYYHIPQIRSNIPVTFNFNKNNG